MMNRMSPELETTIERRKNGLIANLAITPILHSAADDAWPLEKRISIAILNDPAICRLAMLFRETAIVNTNAERDRLVICALASAAMCAEKLKAIITQSSRD